MARAKKEHRGAIRMTQLSDHQNERWVNASIRSLREMNELEPQLLSALQAVLDEMGEEM
jgi:hypothetical protein